MRDLCHRSKCYKQGDFVLEVVLICRKSSKHLGCSLGVTNISHFLSASFALNHINHGRKIILAHIVPAEVPVFGFVLVVIPSSVAKTESITAGIAKPNVVACASSHKSWGYLWIVHDPTISRVKNAVLEEHGGLDYVWLLTIRYKAWYTENI